MAKIFTKKTENVTLSQTEYKKLLEAYKKLGLKQWFLFSVPPLLMGIGVGLSFAGNIFLYPSLYIFLAGALLEIPTLWMIYKHK